MPAVINLEIIQKIPTVTRRVGQITLLNETKGIIYVRVSPVVNFIFYILFLLPYTRFKRILLRAEM